MFYYAVTVCVTLIPAAIVLCELIVPEAVSLIVAPPGNVTASCRAVPNERT